MNNWCDNNVWYFFARDKKLWLKKMWKLKTLKSYIIKSEYYTHS